MTTMPAGVGATVRFVEMPIVGHRDNQRPGILVGDARVSVSGLVVAVTVSAQEGSVATARGRQRPRQGLRVVGRSPLGLTTH